MKAALASLKRLASRLREAERRTERALHPGEISLRGWRELAWTTVRCTLKHRAPSQAGAATFYAFLAFMPAIAAVGSVYGLVADPENLRRRLDAFAEFAPTGLLNLVGGEVLRFAREDRPDQIGAAVGFGVAALFTATSSVRAVMSGLNTAYAAQETRPWWVRRLLAGGFAAGTTLIAMAAGALVLRSADFGGPALTPLRVLVLAARWTVLYAGLVAALAVLYRYGPCRTRARWRWVTPGSALAAAIGLATCAGVTVYLARWAVYERTYGGLGSILGVLIWLWAMMVVVLGGAELNRAMEAKTSADTSVMGRPLPSAPAGGPLPDATAPAPAPPR